MKSSRLSAILSIIVILVVTGLGSPISATEKVREVGISTPLIEAQAKKMLEVIQTLEKNSKYTFKDNEGSSSKYSWHIFYEGRMVGYSYITENGITLGGGWENNGDVGTFFDNTTMNRDQILVYFTNYNKQSSSALITDFVLQKETIARATDSLIISCTVETKKQGNFLLIYSTTSNINNGDVTMFHRQALTTGSTQLVFTEKIYSKNPVYKMNATVYECTKGIDVNWGSCLGEKKIGTLLEKEVNIDKLGNSPKKEDPVATPEAPNNYQAEYIASIKKLLKTKNGKLYKSKIDSLFSGGTINREKLLQLESKLASYDLSKNPAMEYIYYRVKRELNR